MQKYRESVYVSSWHISENENAAMWDRYTQGGDGVAIKTNAKILLDCIPQQSIISDSESNPILPKPTTEPKKGYYLPQRAVIKPIKYIDKTLSDFEMSDKYFYKGYDKICFFYKNVDFKDEKEVRILTSLFLDPYVYAKMTPEQFYKNWIVKPFNFNNSLLRNIGLANILYNRS